MKYFFIFLVLLFCYSHITDAENTMIAVLQILGTIIFLAILLVCWLFASMDAAEREFKGMNETHADNEENIK